ncbi:MAG: hypothetical protein ACTSQE_04215 [Candidatus Heimdallarchaeaceae archaeon]
MNVVKQTIPERKTNPVHKYFWLTICGSVLFISAALVNISNRTVQYLVATSWVFNWLFVAFIASSLIPIAIGVGEIIDLYFKDHVRRDGLQMRTSLLIFAVGEILKPLTLGSVVFGSFALLVSLFFRAFGFRKLDHAFSKIRKITDIKTGGLVYQFYGFYSIIVTVIATLANAAKDETMLIYLLIFNGTIESILMIMVGIKLILDLIKIRKLILERGIKPKYIRLYGNLKDAI